MHNQDNTTLPRFEARSLEQGKTDRLASPQLRQG